MSKKQKLLEKALNNQRNLRFEELLLLAQYLGFELIRTKGSHHMLTHRRLEITLNLQPKDNQAKAYQVLQLIEYLEEFGLGLEDE
jgi:predicted RNA binding protein YcfA (HicA-like mRNA interferase family)